MRLIIACVFFVLLTFQSVFVEAQQRAYQVAFENDLIQVLQVNNYGSAYLIKSSSQHRTFTVFSLSDPLRLVVDLNEPRVKQSDAFLYDSSQTRVIGVRAAPREGTSRYVFDLNGTLPLRYDRYEVPEGLIVGFPIQQGASLSKELAQQVSSIPQDILMGERLIKIGDENSRVLAEINCTPADIRSHYELTQPQRIVIEFARGNTALPSRTFRFAEPHLLQEIRYGRHSEHDRLVFELKEPHLDLKLDMSQGAVRLVRPDMEEQPAIAPKSSEPTPTSDAQTVEAPPSTTVQSTPQVPVAQTQDIPEAKSSPSSQDPLQPSEAESPETTTPEESGDNSTFEALNDTSEEGEVTILDIYMGGELVGEIVGEVTEEWFQIPDVESLVEQLKTIRDAEKLKTLVAGKIPMKREIKGYGSITLDLSTFRLILDILPENLLSKELMLKDLLANPESKFSLQQSLLVSASGTDQGNDQSSFNHQTLLGKGIYSMRYNATSLQDGTYQITEGNFGAALEDFTVYSGLLQSSGFSFANSLEFYGLGASTFEERYLDLQSQQGSSLEIFIPSTSRVEFRLGDRLLSVQILPFGLQEVDTTNFPQGSYEVDIRIIEENGNIINDRRFFNKLSIFGVRGKPIFSFSGGVLRDRIDLVEQPFSQGAVKWRVADPFQLNLAAASTDEESIGSAELLTIFRGVVFGAEVAHSLNQDLGVNFLTQGSFLGLTWSANYSETLQGFDGPETSRFSLLPSQRRTLTGSVDTSLDDISLRFLGSIRESPLLEESFTYGPRFMWTLARTPSSQLMLRGSYFHTEREPVSEVFLSYNYTFGKWSNEVTASSQAGPEDRNFLQNALRYDSVNTTGQGNRASLISRTGERSDLSGKEQVYENRVEVNHTNRYSDTLAYLQDYQEEADRSTTVAANSRTSFVVSDDGDITIAAPAITGALLIANIESNSSEDPIDILIDGQVITSTKAKEQAVVPLSPYRTYRVSIRPSQNADLVYYEDTQYEMVLFPGNIEKITWKVEKIHVVLGQLVDEAGKPLEWVRIKGTPEYVVAETDGIFQAEMVLEKELYVEYNKKRCTLDIPKVDRSESVLDLGTVVCKEANTVPEP